MPRLPRAVRQLLRALARRSVGPAPPQGSCRTRLRRHRRSASARGTFFLPLGVMRPALSPTRRPPRGEISAKVRRDAGAYLATAGPCGPRRLRKPPREPCGLSGTSRSRGLPSGTRVRRFLTWAILWLPAPLLIGASRSHLEPLKAGSGSLPLLALRRYRSAQASWTSSPQQGLPSRRRPLPRQVLDPNAPSGQRREHHDTAKGSGDKRD